jgi:hypothetical protein
MEPEMRRVCALIVSVTALILALAAGVLAAESAKGAGVVTAVSGPVTVSREEALPLLMKFRDALYWRDVVEARKDGIARVLLGGKTTVTVRELSRLELREEVMPEGIRYTTELVAGKVRASVARALMRPGEQVEVRTRNVVASVRGTDFIVETVERPAPGGAFGLMAVREVADGIHGGAARSEETVVVTLSGVVEVANRLGATGRAELVGANEAVRVSGRLDPVRLQLTPEMLRQTLQGLTPPRSREVRSGDATASVSERIAEVTSGGGAAISGTSRSPSSGKSDARSGQAFVASGKGSPASAPTGGFQTLDRARRLTRGHRN